MSEPRPYTLTIAAIRSLTNLEMVRALTLAGLPQSEVARVLGGFDERGQAPEETLAAVTLYYAWAFQYLRRDEPELTWEEVQRMDVELDLEEKGDSAEAEAIISVQAAVITGLPPSEAANLTMAQMDEYRRIAAERERATKRRRRAG